LLARRAIRRIAVEETVATRVDAGIPPPEALAYRIPRIMRVLMQPMLVVSAFLLASCLTRPANEAAQSPPSSSAQRAAAGDPFPVPKEGFSIKVASDSDPKLDALLSEFSRVTGQALLINREVRAMLQSTSAGLNRSVDVPAQEVYPFVEFVLAQNGIVLIPRGGAEPRLLAVENARANRNTIEDAIQVPAGEIAMWARHPAFLVSTVIDLPNSDVRTLSNSMRTLFKDQVTQIFIPVGNSSSLIIIGTGSAAASMVSMLRSVDEIARVDAEKHPAPPKPAAKEPGARESAKEGAVKDAPPKDGAKE
jgi:hypothetical protein